MIPELDEFYLYTDNSNKEDTMILQCVEIEVESPIVKNSFLYSNYKIISTTYSDYDKYKAGKIIKVGNNSHFSRNMIKI